MNFCIIGQMVNSQFGMVLLMIFISLFYTVNGGFQRAELEKKVLTDLYLKSKFHAYVRPYSNASSSDDPVRVAIDLYLLKLDVDVINQEFDVTMYFRQEWNDPRLVYNNQDKLSYVVLHDVIGIWTPDLFFVHEKEAHLHTVTKPNSFARIYPDGKVLYSQRLSIKSSCPMNFKLYPFDRQICYLRVESYGYTVEDILLHWKPGREWPAMGSPSVPKYILSYSNSNFTITVGDNKYSAVVMDIHLKRFLSNFFFNVYIPIALLVVASWVTFFLDPNLSFLRVLISFLITFFALTVIYGNRHLFVSPGYPTALDIWIAFCFILLSAAIFENICVISEHQRHGLDRKRNSKTESNLIFPLLTKLLTKMDCTAKILFPSLFALFQIFYTVFITTGLWGRESI